MRILVAEDDDDLRGAVARLLADDGHEVIEAIDGESALELLADASDSAAKPDVILLDFCLPGFSGLGILRVGQRFGKMPPTILMTGFPDPSVDTIARSVGAVRVLRKPFDENDLRDAVVEALRWGDERLASSSR